jgi:ubiquitin carboxyl-terminal hydrolase 7
MATKVGEMLKHDPLKLRFTQSNGQNGSPKSIIRRQGALTVAELIQPGYMASTANLLYYELLDVSIIELETKKSLRITWVGGNNREDVSCFAAKKRAERSLTSFTPLHSARIPSFSRRTPP